MADYVSDWDLTIPKNGAPYAAILPASSVVTEVLTAGAYYVKGDRTEFNRLVAIASKMNFKDSDAADAGQLNEMLWKSATGMGSKEPAPKHSALFGSTAAVNSVSRAAGHAGAATHGDA